MMDRLQPLLLHATRKIIDALKNLDQRMLCLEDRDDPYPRHDATWESLNISAAQLKILADEEEERLPKTGRGFFGGGR
jgi:hypothetical protein